jgi:hypothetical protein
MGKLLLRGHVEGLANAMQRILVDVETRRRMGAASRDIISRWSYAECAVGLQRALVSTGVVASPQPSPANLLDKC